MESKDSGAKDELRSAFLYRVLAKKEAGSPRERLFKQLAEEAENQAAIWEKKHGKVTFTPDLRTRLVVQLIQSLGPKRIRHILAAMKVRGLSVYSGRVPGHPMPVSVDEVGHRHVGAGEGGNLRAAVFGVNDGLLSNASLILGVAGAATESHLILVSGVAGLLAGAFSMAAGEFLSVASQKEMFEYQIGLEKEELEIYPAEEAKELALIFEARGLSQPEARDFAERIIADPTKALDTLAREELGLNPESLSSPHMAALFSFVSFAFGAGVPLLPFLLLPSISTALYVSIGLTGFALFIIGMMLSLFTGRKAFLGGLRMLLLGTGAGLATFMIGSLVGARLS